jgi:predicted permease
LERFNYVYLCYMSSIILLFLCLVLGIIAQRIKSFPNNSHIAFNQFLLNFSLPALALYYVPKMDLSLHLLIPLAMPWLHFGLAFLLFNFLGKKYNWSKKLIGCLILTAGLGNTSFMGIPIIQALYGDEGLKTLIVIDLPGTFMILSTIGIIVANIYANNASTSKRDIWYKILSFPTIWAFVIGLVINIGHINMPKALEDVLSVLSKTVSPLALVSVGLQLKIEKHNPHNKFLFLGLAFKLLIIPALCYVIIRYVLHLDNMMGDVTIIESAMAPMITAAIIASSYGLKPKLSNLMIGVGIPVSFITIAIWYLLVNF